MAIGNRVIISLLLCHYNQITHGRTSPLYSVENGTDCIESDVGTRPEIWPIGVAYAQYAIEGDPRSTSIDVHSVAALTNNVFISVQFNCTHHLPIHWVFHLDPKETTMNVEVDFFERKILPGNESRNGSRFIYSANFRLLYLFRDLQTELLFSCEPVLLMERCERNFLQVRKNHFELPTETPLASLKAMSEALLRSSLNMNAERERNCTLNLMVKIEQGNDISYKWETDDTINGQIEETTRATNETAYFDNAFRLDDIADEQPCITMLSQDEPCTGCKYVGSVRNYTRNGVIFHASYNNEVRLYKGFFSVPEGGRPERKFYFSWSISRKLIEEEMIQIHFKEPIYANQPFTVVCRVSTFLFAYGTIITDKLSPELDEDQAKEYFRPFGYRNVTRDMILNTGNKIQNVSCFAPLKKSTDWIVKSREVFVEDATPPTIDGASSTVEHRTVTPGENAVTADCNVTGNPNPSPTFKWILPSKLAQSDRNKIQSIMDESFNRIVFPTWEANYFGTYLCEAENKFGKSRKSITFQVEPVETASQLAIIISSILGGFTVLLGVLIAVLAWRIRRQRLDFEIQTQKAIDEFKNGVDPADNLPEKDILNPNFSVLQLPYNEDFEISRANWSIEEKVLGSGQFGIVKMGNVLLKGQRIKVAVKSLKSAVEIDEFKSFLFELKIMAYLGQHKNIVSVVAACTEGINDRDIFIGVEFCENGCLLDYLRKFLPTFKNMVTENGKLTAETTFTDGGQYTNIAGISTYDLYRWAYHVASGMDYLRIKNVLHGDLAARNVLINSRKVAKVGDFGLSRVLLNSENYTKKTQTALPWKSLAIESLQSRVFSFNSDCWAYGVFLYELFTLGQTPYPGISWSPDFVTQLENGLRMDKPVFCTNSVYKLMRSCWEHEPQQRPSYVKVKRKLSKGLQNLSVIRRNTQPNNASSSKPKIQKSPVASVPTAANDTDISSINEFNEEGGIYSNLHRRTMNEYGNC